MNKIENWRKLKDLRQKVDDYIFDYHNHPKQQQWIAQSADYTKRINEGEYYEIPF